jgi:hypothetical protein
VDKLDYSVLTDRSLGEIAADEGSAEWQSNRKAAVRKGAEWLQDSLSRANNDKRAPAKTASKKKSIVKKSSVKKNSSRKRLKTKPAPGRRAA